MKKIPQKLRLTVAGNLLHCRATRFPGKGGSKKCADTLGITQQQWSQWELGKRMPGECWLAKIAEFFGTTTHWLRDKHDFHDDAVQKMDVSLEAGDMRAFFQRLELALSHPDRGDIVVSITMKANGRKGVGG